MPDRLEKQAGYLRANSDVVLLGSQGRAVNAQGKEFKKMLVPAGMESIRWFPVFH